MLLQVTARVNDLVRGHRNKVITEQSQQTEMTKFAINKYTKNNSRTEKININ